jgi:carbonic anhydrase
VSCCVVTAVVFSYEAPHQVKESVKRQVENIVKTDVIQKAWAEKKNVHVHGMVYELDTGKLTDLGVTRKGQ